MDFRFELFRGTLDRLGNPALDGVNFGLCAGERRLVQMTGQRFIIGDFRLGRRPQPDCLLDCNLVGGRNLFPDLVRIQGLSSAIEGRLVGSKALVKCLAKNASEGFCEYRWPDPSFPVTASGI